MKRCLFALLVAAVLLAGCRAPQTVIVTQEVVREVEVTRVVEVTRADRASPPPATPTPTPTDTPLPTPIPSRTPTYTATPRPTQTSTPRPTQTPTTTATPTTPPSTGRQWTVPTPGPAPTAALEQLADRDPGPPFAVLVSTVRAEADSAWTITGLVRNDGAETYEAIALNATFYDDEGFRHGPLDVRCPCVLLGPGEGCPFSIQAPLRRPVSFLLHPDGRPTKRQSAPLEVRSAQLVADGLTSVHVTGVVVNPHPFKVKNPVVIGTLLDGGGQIVSMDWSYILQEDIEPEASVPFAVRVEEAPFARYQLYAQAERDWE